MVLGVVTVPGRSVLRAGDLVRFKYTSGDHEGWKVGLLKEYHTWEKIATIIYEGKEVRVVARLTQLHKRAKRTQTH